jgi:hypothetical protein
MTLDAYRRPAGPHGEENEMWQSSTTSAATPDVIEDAEPIVVNHGMSDVPALISVQQVALSTAAAVSWRPARISRGVIEAIRGVGAALSGPPAQRHHLPRSSYLESARMAREMDRL